MRQLSRFLVLTLLFGAVFQSASASAHLSSSICVELFSSTPYHAGELNVEMSNEKYAVYFLGEGASGRVYRFIPHDGSPPFERKFYKGSRALESMEEDLRGLKILDMVVNRLSTQGTSLWRVPEILNVSREESYVDLSDTIGEKLNRRISITRIGAERLAKEYREITDLLSTIPLTELNQLFDQKHQLLSRFAEHIGSEDSFQFGVDFQTSSGSQHLLIKPGNIVVDSKNNLVIIDPM